MKHSSLTNRPLNVGGRLAHTYEVDGCEYTVWDSIRSMLLVIELFGDQDFEPEEKLQLLVAMLFADAGQLPSDAGGVIAVISSVLWDAAGIDIDGTRSDSYSGEGVFDWQQDAGRIKASLRMAYGIDWDTAADTMTFYEVCDLLGMLMESESKTPFQEAVFFRTAKQPKRTKDNGEYVDAWLKRREHFRLKSGNEDEQPISREDKASEAFEKLWRAAHNG